MAQPLPPDTPADVIEEELSFLDVMITSLDPGADDYERRLAELEGQKVDYRRRLDQIQGGGDMGGGQPDLGMDGSNDFWAATMGGRPSSGGTESAGSAESPFMQQNGLKRSLNGGGSYPSKRHTPDPSNAGTPTSSSSFEWVDHPSRPSQAPQQSSVQQMSRDKARQRQLQAEAALQRKREAELADQQYARQLSQAHGQQRSASSSSQRPNVQTTLNTNGSFSRPPMPPPTPALTPSQEQQLRNAVSPHGHPSQRVKVEPGPSKPTQYGSSPLTTRTKAPTAVVDLTGSDSSDDDLAEVAPSAFSPNSRRRPQPASGFVPQNRLPFDPNRILPSQRAPAMPPSRPPTHSPRPQMPGAWPGAVQVPSSDNGYVYRQQGQPQQYAPPPPPPQPQPEWLRNTNGLLSNPAVSNAYNGMRNIASGFSNEIDNLTGLINGAGSRNPYGGSARSGYNYNRHPSVEGDDDDDDDVIFGGSRPLPPGQAPPQLPPGYANQEAYRQRFDEMMNQNPAKTMEEINALMENIRPDEDMPADQRVETPEALSVALHKYQELGLTWLQRCEDGKTKGGILADDMGLGKTIQMLSLIVTHKSADPACKTTLIIAPVALMRQWKQEIETKVKRSYNHRLSVYIHHGPSRKKSFNDLRHFDVVLTTFGTLTAELKKLEKFMLRKRFNPEARPGTNEKCALLGDDVKWYRVVLDEAQCIKNSNTQGAKAACRLNAQFRFCMTGTPMMNNVDELWSLIHFLRIKPYCERHHFQRDFTKRLKHEYSRKDAMTALQALIRSIMLRRTKQSKFEGRPILVLPERTTIVDNPEFSEDEMAFYQALEKNSRLEFNKYLKKGTVGSSYSAILVLLLRLRQACCHPHLIQDFGVSAAAGVSPETLVDLAKTLEPAVVERIRSTNGNFECPVCYDAVTNPAIFVPCGHDTCQECFAKIADNAARNGEGGGGTGNAKCPNCRGEINSKKITDFESFKTVHMPDQLTEEQQEELRKLQEQFEESESDEDDDSDSETESGDDVNGNGDLDGFVVKDDVEDSETESEAEEDAQEPGVNGVEDEANDSDDDNVVNHSRRASGKKDKGKAKVTDKQPAKPKKSRKAKGKKREKKDRKEKKKKKSHKTLADLKKEATRSRKGRLAYIKKLNEDWVTSAKIEKTMETLKEIMENPEGERVLIFSQWTSLLDLLECPIYREGWGYRRYDGSMNAGMRADAVDDFRDVNKDVRIMLVSLKAGNAGLNLNMASQVIILDPFWNP